MLGATIVSLLGLAAYGYWQNKQHAAELAIISQQRKELAAIAAKYNSKVKNLMLEDKNAEGSYNKVKREYNKAASLLKTASPITRIWKKIFIAGCILICFSGCFGLVQSVDNSPSQINALMDSRSWNADNIPMPHMEDHSLYVSNPDSILSEEVVDSINETLGRLDDILGIESVMAIVGHIDGDDPVAMVRGIYDKYHVGRNDRGLVIVVGYLDHSYFIAPGRSLEGDLTDLECNHLAQDYLIPSMKAEKPDSGMLYLASGVYALMADKEMPQMSALSSSSNDEESDFSFAAYPMLFIIWLIFYRFMGQKVSPTMGVSSLMGNPFASGGGGSSFGGGGFSGGGGGFSSGGGGGGFGGGSWGGGGSGGRW